MKIELNGNTTEKCTVYNELEGGACGKPDRISWVKELDSQEVLTFQGVESSEVNKPGTCDNGVLSSHKDGVNHSPNDSSENCSAASGLCPESEDSRATICNEDAGSLKNVKNCDNVSAKPTAFTTTESKSHSSASESDSTGIESTIPLRERLSKKKALKKPKTSSDDETIGRRKGEDYATYSAEVDSVPLASRLSNKNTIQRPKTALRVRVTKLDLNEAANKREETNSFPEPNSTDVDSVALHPRMLKKNTLKQPETASSFSDEASGKRKKEDSIALPSKKGALKKPKTASGNEASGKESGTDSIADATEVDSISLSSGLSKRNAVEKVKPASGDEAACQRKGADSIAVRAGDDSDFESPKAGRSSAGKRKGSDLSDDQDLLTSVFSTDSQNSSTSNREARVGLNSKKRRTKKADVSERKVLKPARKRITKRQMKGADRPTAEALEGKA